MMAPTESESARLAALASYAILDSLPEEEYDAITRVTAQICGTPISLLTLIDDHRQWFKSALGTAERQIPREYSFCLYTIEAPGQVAEIPDIQADSRFDDNPLATGESAVRFYAGIALVDEEGHALGTLCVIDNKPNKLSGEQAAALKSLGSQAVSLLQLRRSQGLLSAANQQLQTLNAALHETNQVLQAVVDTCPAGLVLWRAVRQEKQIVDFAYVLTNPVNARITGLSVAQMTGESLKSLFPNVAASHLFERLVTVVETGQPQQYQQHEQMDQIDIWGDFSLVPLGDGVLFTFQDITRLKETEEQLRTHTENLELLVLERTNELQKKNQELNTFFEVALDLHCIARPDGTILKTNRAWQTTLGYPAADLLMMNHLDLVHPEDRDATRLVVSQLTPHHTNRHVNRFRQKNGTYRVIEWNVVAIDGLLHASARDITDRQVAEKQLKKLNQRLQLATQAAELGIWEYNLEQDELTWDERICAIHGIDYSEKPMRLQVYRQLIHPDDRSAFDQRRYLSQASATFMNERRIIRPDGAIRYTELYGTRISNRSGQPVGSVGVIRDITGRKEKERVLQQSLAREQELNRLKSQFVATASHEFRTPLATIQSSVDLIKLYNEQPTATTQAAIQRHLHVIEKEIVNFSDLLADILTFGKIEVGKIPFIPQPVDVMTMIDSVVATHFSERPDGRTVAVSLAGIPRPIQADKKLISHALVNLLSNAFKYSASNPSLHIAFAETELRLLVSDEGIGIPADELVHLFETFFRARNAVNIQGSGLGLVITRQFVEQHGGRLEVQSQENQGTTCTITLPG